MKTIFIHIGREKTGTTSLQNFLAVNHRKLLEYNIFYPVDKTKKYNYWNQQVTLIPSIIKKKILVLGDENNYIKGEALEEFVNDIKKIKQEKILISSEFFVRLYNDASLNLLRESLKGFNIKIIIYIRSQEEFYLSTRSEIAKAGRPFEISVDDATKFKSASHYNLINRWAKVFGERNMIVRIFEKAKMYKNDLYADFLNIFGVEIDDSFKISKRLNESISLEKVLLLQKLTNYLVPFHEETNAKRILHQEIRNYIINSDLFTNGELRNYFTFEQKRIILDHYEGENALIAKDYLGIDNLNLFEIVNKDKKDVYPEMTNDDFIKALIKLIEDLHDNVKRTEHIFHRFMMICRDSEKLTRKRIDFEYNFIVDKNIFDKEYYLETYSDVMAAGVDPIMHYIKYGWYEGRNPRADFNTKKYIIDNMEVLDQDINPLIHCHMKNNL